MTVNQLIARAKELGIKGYSKLNKADLEKVVEMAENQLMFDKLQKSAKEAALNGKLDKVATEQFAANVGYLLDGLESDEVVRLGGPKRLFYRGVNMNRMKKVTCRGLAFRQAVDQESGEPLFDSKGNKVLLTKHYPVFKQEMPLLDLLPAESLELPENTPLFNAVVQNEVVVYKLCEDGPENKLKLYKLLMLALFNQDTEAGREVRFGIFNPKKRHSYVVVGTRKQLHGLLGDDVIAKHDNAFKVATLIMGPSAFQYVPELSRNEKKFSMLLINQEYLADGTPIHDGCVITDTKFFINRYSTDEEGKATPDDQREWFQVYSAQWRCKEQTLGKWKSITDPVLKRQVMERNGFKDLVDKVDAVSSIGNLKTWPVEWKHGQIVEFSLDDLRIVSAKVSDGTSSIGAQSIRLDHNMVQRLLVENGAPERALVLKHAIEGHASAYERVLKADKDNTLGDAVKEYIQYLAYSFKDSDGEYKVRFYEGAWRHALARFLSYYIRDVVKCRTTKLSLYVQCDKELDDAEEKYFKEHGKWINYVKFPGTRKVKNMLKKYGMINVGRNPMVGPGNAQGVSVLRKDGNTIFNPTTDTLYVSARFLYSMFGDEDGDSIIIIPSNVAHFPVFRRPAPPAEPPKSKYVAQEEADKVTNQEIFMKLIEGHTMVTEAAINTGRADLITRLIITTNKTMGNELSYEQLLEMAEFCELQIQSMKRKGGKTATAEVTEDVVDQIIGLFWKQKGKLARGEKAPKEYRLLTRNAALKPEFSSDSGIMMAMIKLLNDPIPYCKTVPHHVIWEQMKGVTPSMDHQHSGSLREFFDKRWKSIAPHLTAGGFNIRNEDGTIFFRAFNWRKLDKDGNLMYSDDDRQLPLTELQVIRVVGEAIVKHYNASAFAAKDIEDNYQRRVAFSTIRDNIRSAMKAHEPVEDTVDKYGFTNVDYYYRALTVYIGMKGFGVVPDRDDPRIKHSLGGSAFWYLPEKYLIQFALLLDPENPWALKAEKQLPEILLKQKIAAQKRQARIAAGEQEEE